MFVFNPIAQLFAAFSINRLPFVQMTVSEVESNLCPYFRVGECRSYRTFISGHDTGTGFSVTL
jgi:hypothetical protein